MIKKVNFHTHTNFCDGKNTPEEMVKAAIEKGFSVIGFSGHSYTSFDERYCMSEEGTKKYIAEITRLKEAYKEQIEILCGLEADYFAIVNKSDFDFIIGSVHYVLKNGKFYSVDESKEDFINAVNEGWSGDICAFIADYYAQVADVIEKTDADIIGHFDLVTKFNEGEELFSESDPRYVKAVDLALSKLLKTEKPFEINTGAMAKGYRTAPYPSKDILTKIYEGGGKVIISSDCHDKDYLDYGFEMAEKIVKEIGFN